MSLPVFLIINILRRKQVFLIFAASFTETYIENTKEKFLQSDSFDGLFFQGKKNIRNSAS